MEYMKEDVVTTLLRAAQMLKDFRSIKFPSHKCDGEECLCDDEDGWAYLDEHGLMGIRLCRNEYPSGRVYHMEEVVEVLCKEEEASPEVTAVLKQLTSLTRDWTNAQWTIDQHTMDKDKIDQYIEQKIRERVVLEEKMANLRTILKKLEEKGQGAG